MRRRRAGVPRRVRELLAGEAPQAGGKTLVVKGSLPAESVRVFTIEY